MYATFLSVERNTFSQGMDTRNHSTAQHSKRHLASHNCLSHYRTSNCTTSHRIASRITTSHHTLQLNITHHMTLHHVALQLFLHHIRSHHNTTRQIAGFATRHAPHTLSPSFPPFPVRPSINSSSLRFLITCVPPSLPFFRPSSHIFLYTSPLLSSPSSPTPSFSSRAVTSLP